MELPDVPDRLINRKLPHLNFHNVLFAKKVIFINPCALYVEV